MPLALVGWLIALVLIAHNTYQILSIFYIETDSGSGENDDGSLEFGDWLNVGVNSLQLTFVVVGVLCLLVGSSRGIALLLSGFRVLYTTIIMQSITTCLTWLLIKTGLDDKGNNDISRYEVFHFAITSSFGVILFVTSYWTFGALQSLVLVVQAGGNGWEYQNAIQVKERCFEQFLIAGHDNSRARLVY